MAERIRVLHVITRLIRGGADENTVFTVERVDPARYDSRLLAGRGSEPETFGPDLQARTEILPCLVRDPHPWHDVVALFRMVRLMRAGRYHIVHTHTAKAGFLGRIAARLAGVPVVVHTLHGVTFHEHIHPAVRRIYVWMERLAARTCDVMITVGEDVKSRYLEQAIGSSDQYVTIPSGMDLTPFLEARDELRAGRRPVRDELGFAPDDIVMGMVSRLEPRKGWNYFLDAVERLTPDFPALRALIVGEGAQRTELEGEVRRRGLKDRVVFAGYRTDVARVIAAMDVAVLTSLWEGLPRVLVQYAMLERPIVSFEVEGSREVIDSGRSGWVVPLRDVDALVDRLRPLVASAELRATFGRRCREHVEGRWDVAIMVDRIQRLYDEAVPAGS